MVTKTRILIVDDHPMMRRGLRELLADEPHFEICAEAADGPEALDRARETRPDLAILDLSLPSGSGLELAKQLRAVVARLRIIILSMHDDTLFAARARRAGAVAYLNKSCPVEELLDTIAAVARGRHPSTETPLAAGEVPARKADVGLLSDRELEVFELIGRGLRPREIADRLSVSVKTVDTHREHIKAKLGLESGLELVRRATVWVNDPA